MSAPSQEPAPVAAVQPSVAGANALPENPVKMQRPFMDGDFEFVSLSSFFSIPNVLMQFRVVIKVTWLCMGGKTGHKSSCVNNLPISLVLISDTFSARALVLLEHIPDSLFLLVVSGLLDTSCSKKCLTFDMPF